VKACFVGRGATEDKVGFENSISPASTACGLVVAATNFYAEQGGQIYDTGTITSADGAIFRVDNVQIFGGFVLHIGEVVKGSFSVDAGVTMTVNYVRRSPIASNHTMTHVLNYALRDVLIGKDNIGASNYNGPAVDQKGSLVDENKMRFDFSWGKGVELTDLAKVEALCQKKIADALPVQAYNAPLENAQQISALRAVFGEKYPDPVRIISVCATSIPEILEKPTETIWKDYSIEFCGGTHLTNTSEAQKFVLISEEGIAKGIRRITAVTQERARDAVNTANAFAERTKDVATLEGALLVQEVKKLCLEINQLEISCVAKNDLNVVLKGLSARCQAWTKAEAKKKTDAAVTDVTVALNAAKEAGKNKAVVRVDFGVNGKDSQNVFKAITKTHPDMACLIVTADFGANKFACFASAPKGVEVDCKKWVEAATEGLGGRGGGKPNSAQISVEGVEGIQAAFDKAQAAA